MKGLYVGEQSPRLLAIEKKKKKSFLEKFGYCKDEVAFSPPFFQHRERRTSLWMLHCQYPVPRPSRSAWRDSISPLAPNVGGNAFKANMTGDIGEQGSCTTCTFTEDLSNYWTAVMFFKHTNSSYKRVFCSAFRHLFKMQG